MENAGLYIWLWILIGNAAAVIALLNMSFSGLRSGDATYRDTTYRNP